VEVECRHFYISEALKSPYSGGVKASQVANNKRASIN
jgi:hypothetical protein